MTAQMLVKEAIKAMEMAYAPYSGYKVGAALLCADGTVYRGCNVENASYGATNCAERTAIFKAVSEGQRKFAGLAICGGKGGILSGQFPPCGICRQVIREFCADDFPIYLVESAESWQTCTLSQLLPHSFRADTHMQD